MTARKKKKIDSSNEVLSKQVRSDGVGEHQVVQDLLSDKFTKGSNREALEISLALQQLVRGQTSLLENQQALGHEISKVRERMDRIDRDTEKWEKDREGFIQEVLDKAESLKPVNKDKAVADGVQMYQNALAEATAQVAVKRLKFADQLARSPKVTVISPGEIVQVIENGSPVSKLMNEVVRIKHMQWVLPAGVPTEVPEIVAEVLKNRRRGQQETAERQALMMKNMESGKLNDAWNAINNKYHSPTDVVPGA